MSLVISPSTHQERKLLFEEILLDTTDKVSKVSPFSVLDGIAEGVAKVSGKAEKDIMLSLAQLFPDNSNGAQLDQCAENFGISPRFLSAESSTYVLIIATPGTIYNKNLHLLQSKSGIQFQLEENTITIPQEGYIYAKVKSVVSGSQTNVKALTINRFIANPAGHLYVVNEVEANGGRDIEEDNLFRQRIKDGANIYARGTLAMLTQKFMSVNSKVLKCFYEGVTINGKSRISIVTQNGVALTPTELEQLINESWFNFSLTEQPSLDTSRSQVELVNVEFQPFDVSFQFDWDTSYDIDEIRRVIQIRIMKYIDHRYFDSTRQKVEWDNLLEIVKSTPGVTYVPDQDFFPREDISIDTHKLPRLRGFRMKDLEGNIIRDLTGTLTPLYYSNAVDFKYQQYL